MLAQVGDDRSNLIALARLYCEQCDSQILATESNDAFLLSSCVSDILSNTRYKLKESVKLLKSLRRSFILDEDKCQALLLRLTKHMCEHGTADDREWLELCGVWAEGEGARMRMHTAQALVDAWCETDMRDRDKTLPQVLDTNSTGKLANGLSLSLVPFAAAAAADTRTHTRTQGGHRQGQDEGTRRREAAVRLKHVLKAQFELENYRAQKLARATLTYEEKVSAELLRRHQHLLKHKELLASSLMHSTSVV